jgi:hypothetical protein
MKKLLLTIGILLAFCTNSFAATGWLKTKPAGTSNASDIDTYVGENNAALDLMLSKYRQGCLLSYASTSTLTVGSGGVMVSNSDASVRLMLANTSATTVSWTDIDTGAEAVSTTYYIYAIASATTDTTFTCKISTSSSAPNGVTYYVRLGSFYNDASGNITNIVNDNFPVKSYDSGWFAVSNASSYTKTHNLGTTKVLATVYISDTSDGSGKIACTMGELTVDGASNHDMTGIRALSATTVTLRTGSTRLAATQDSSGTAWSPTSGYARVILLALE